MLANHLKVAFRTLRRQKQSTAINLVGLGASLSLCLLILLFIREQRAYDRFHEHADRVYRVTSRLNEGRPFATSPVSLVPVLKDSYAAVEDAVRLRRFGGTASLEDRHVDVQGLYAEPSFFNLFSFRLRSGDPARALTAPNSVVLTPRAAEALFGTSDPIGKAVRIGAQGEFTVTGVLEANDRPTTLQFDALASFATVAAEVEQADYYDSAFFNYSYLLLREGVRPQDLEPALAEVLAKHFSAPAAGKIVSLTLQPLTGIRLGPGLGNQLGFTLPAPVVYGLGVLAALVMLVAWFNYLNLSVARALRRAREIGVRKVVGARRRQIVGQFVTESVVLTLASCVLALGLLLWLVPSFNSLWAINATGSQIGTDFWLEPGVYLLCFGFSLAVGLVVGFLPALHLSSFRPVLVLKGAVSEAGRSRHRVRKALVVAQFGFALLFVLTVLLLYRQAGVILTAEHGFQEENVLNVELGQVPYEAFRERLLASPNVESVSAVSLPPASGMMFTTGLWVTPTDRPPIAGIYSADYDLMGQLGVPVVAGRGLSEAFAGDREGRTAVVNEAAVRAFGFSTPEQALGQTATVEGFHDAPDEQYQIVGVVRDFHFDRLEVAIAPMLVYHRPEQFGWATVKLRPGNAAAALADVQAVWRQLDPANTMKYQRYDYQIREQYAIYQDGAGILSVVAVFAILIACLGLVGMSAYSAEVRWKEVGIRKVLGASVPGVVGLLSREYLVLVGVAVLIAAPLAYFLNNLWLQHVAVRAEFGPGVFVPGILGLLVLAALAIGSQTLRAALANPADTLRSE